MVFARETTNVSASWDGKVKIALKPSVLITVAIMESA